MQPPAIAAHTKLPAEPKPTEAIVKAFRCTEIRQLAHELTMAPARQRARQIDGIMRAIDVVEASREYPYSLICYHITGYRSRRGDGSMLSGKDLQADLVELLDVLTAKCPIDAESAEGRLHDSDALAQRFSVSTKTISRWRVRGLAGAWYTNGDDKPRLCFTERSVELFVARNEDLVRRGAAFQVMTDAEKHDIIARARVLVAARKCSLHAATLEISNETGRAVETIRYTLRRFDRDNPADALFDRKDEARAIDECTVLLEAFENGKTPRQLAAEFGKREVEIQRLLAHARVRRFAESPIEYMYNPAFDAPDAEETFLSDDARPSKSASNQSGEPDETLHRPPADLPPYLQALYRTPLLGRDEESTLFARMNYLLHVAETHRKKLVASDARATQRDLAAVEGPLEAAKEIKNRIIQANLRLVVSIAKRHVFGHPALNLFELISDGNVTMMRAVDKFDYARGFRFSTYATWAITRGFARSVPETLAHSDRYQTGCDESLATVGDTRESVEALESSVAAAKAVVARSLRLLDQRERVIVERHFGIGENSAGETLEEIGRHLGISKERVRQLEIRALTKLRTDLGDHGAALLAG